MYHKQGSGYSQGPPYPNGQNPARLARTAVPHPPAQPVRALPELLPLSHEVTIFAPGSLLQHRLQQRLRELFRYYGQLSIVDVPRFFASDTMNLCLLDPFQSDFPEVIEEYLEHGNTKCIAFNRRGTLLAAGCTDGSCVIWDFDTRGVAKELRDPDCSAPVTSVSWSKCGHRLLAAATDKQLALWDVAKGSKISHITLPQAALHCCLDPGTAFPPLCLACPLSGAPILVDFTESGHPVQKPVPVVVTGDGSAGNARGKHGDASAAYSPSTASFNKKGDLIYVGNFRGEILIVDTKSCKVRAVVPICGGAAIRHIAFSRNGQYLLTNSNDRIIRVFENLQPRHGAAARLSQIVDSFANGNVGGSGDFGGIGMQCLQMTREYQDAVNRMHWKSACFNGDGECVVGASANKGEHKIHIWNRNFGQLARILEGPKEGLSDLAWHPTRPVVASVSMSGAIYLWAKDYTENWSAFAPDFKELEENEEYVEQEDEFDIVLDDKKAQAPSVGDDEEVDIITMEKVAAFSDSDESQDGLYFLPTVPVRDEPVETPFHEQPVTPLKPSSSSATESDQSPTSEPEPDAREMELTANSMGPFLEEEEVGVNGRTKRKRKLTERAAELQAEKGRKSAQKVRTPNPKLKQEDTSNSPRSSLTSKGGSKNVWMDVSANTVDKFPPVVSTLEQDMEEAEESNDDDDDDDV